MGKQQIMTLVGNGFDISVLKKYGKGVTTSYQTFYSFFKFINGEDCNNFFIEQMKEAKDKDEPDWSDFEALLAKNIENITSKDSEKIKQLNNDLKEIQHCFARFLNQVVDSDIINKLSNATSVDIDCGKWGEITYPERSYTCFLGDLSCEQYKKCKFHNRIDHGEQLKYIFIDFNYTSLLDNYLYLDKDIFSPEPYYTSDNNINFITNPKEYDGHCTIEMRRSFLNASCKMLPVDIYHPHGYQDIPKSLLFGTESLECDKVKDERRTFIKSYWARDEERYADKFKETSLFIVYGCSLGSSDSWWWNKIYERLLDEDFAELFIYNYENLNRDSVIKKFMNGCGKESMTSDEYDKIAEHIFIIDFGDNNDDIVFLQLPELPSDY